MKVLIWAQAEHAIQDPTLVDIRLMRDFSGQRPVDVALSFGYERLGVLLDPSQPIELLSSHVGRGADRTVERRLLFSCMDCAMACLACC